MLSLNRNELETLRILWQQGPLKPAQLQALFAWPIENATLRSVLVNLVEKGHVTRRLEGKAFFYEARVPKTTLFQEMMRTVARVFAGGSQRELVAQLVETGDIRADDLKLISETAKGNSQPKARRKTS